MDRLENMAENILQRRMMRGLSQKELAEKLGISAQAVSKWETGQSYPDISLLPKLCEVLEVDANSLFSEPISMPISAIPKGRYEERAAEAVTWAKADGEATAEEGGAKKETGEESVELSSSAAGASELPTTFLQAEEEKNRQTAVAELPADFRKLKLSFMSGADIRVVRSEEGNSLRVTATPEELENMVFEERDGKFYVTDRRHRKNLELNINLGSAKDWLGLLNTVIGGQKKKPRRLFEIHIRDAHVRSLEIECLGGAFSMESEVKIGKLKQSANGSARMHLDEVEKLKAETCGSQKIEVRRLRSASVEGAGSCHVSVGECTGGKMKFEVAGSFRFEGKGGSLELFQSETAGSCQIHAPEVAVRDVYLSSAGSCKHKFGTISGEYMKNGKSQN